MREYLGGRETLLGPIWWNFEFRMRGLRQTPEEVFHFISDPHNAGAVPGIKEAHLVAGEAKNKGALYECRLEFEKLKIPIGGTFIIEVIDIESPHRVSSRLYRAGVPFPFSGLFLHVNGKGEWKVIPEEEGTTLMLQTEGEISGAGVGMLRLLGVNRDFIEHEAVQMFRNIKDRMNKND